MKVGAGKRVGKKGNNLMICRGGEYCNIVNLHTALQVGLWGGGGPEELPGNCYSYLITAKYSSTF